MAQDTLVLMIICGLSGIFCVAGIFVLAFLMSQTRAMGRQLTQLESQVASKLNEQQIQLNDRDANLKESLLDQFHRFRHDIGEKLQNELKQHSGELSKQVNDRLDAISTNVEKRLNTGFEKTTETFMDIAKRLALIDDAQKKLMELSGNVVNLKDILIDKRSRGAFGETQLNNLIDNMLPKENFALQYQLSNGLRCDCILFLPQPTGNVVIDAKFPLENYQRFTNIEASQQEKQKAKQLFRQNIRKHVQDIADKYIIAKETADGAIMFIPAEAVFSEIHSEFPDLVEFAQHRRVWLASPTTMMAILTTASAVLKDTATREHVHIIQAHLRELAKDFERFEGRMLKLARHIEQAQDDVKQVHTSAKKITQRFQKIEQVELGEATALEEAT